MIGGYKKPKDKVQQKVVKIGKSTKMSDIKNIFKNDFNRRMSQKSLNKISEEFRN